VDTNYVTVGTAPGPTTVPPADLIDQSGSTADKYVVQGMKEGSLFRDNEELKTEENAIIDPQTDHKVDPSSPEGQKYGPSGRVLKHDRKDLFKDWDA
jgi:hypothetical protein